MSIPPTPAPAPAPAPAIVVIVGFVIIVSFVAVVFAFNRDFFISRADAFDAFFRGAFFGRLLFFLLFGDGESAAIAA